jgi:hypothetical protein
MPASEAAEPGHQCGRSCNRGCGPAGAILIGVDLVKDDRILEAAYDDQALFGVFYLEPGTGITQREAG